MNKTIKLEIIKPVNENWNLFNKILNGIQNETSKISNRCIQLAWEYSNFESEYKSKYDVYPVKKDVLNGYGSVEGFCYKDVVERYCKSNTGNISQTTNKVFKKFYDNLADIKNNNISIPSFKKKIPIDIKGSSIKLSEEKGKYYLVLSLISEKYKKELNLKSELKLKSGQFKILIKAKDNSTKTILNRIINKEYKISASQIIKSNKGKWFINLSYSFKAKSNILLSSKNIMGIDLGINKAAYIAFNSSLDRYYIEGGEINEFRKRIESRRKQLLKQGKYCGKGRIGHGRSTRIKPIEKLSNKIKNFRDTTNHKYSKYIIDLALKHNCGIIQMENLSGINKNNKFLKNWSYYDLQQKIINKAAEFGIKVIKISPNYTSQRCSECGHIQKENRNGESFKCLKCGYETHADYNAARNIATKNIDKIIRESLIENSLNSLNLQYKKNYKVDGLKFDYKITLNDGEICLLDYNRYIDPQKKNKYLEECSNKKKYYQANNIMYIKIPNDKLMDCMNYLTYRFQKVA